MAHENEIAVDAGTIRHRIIDAVEGFREQMKDPMINEQSRSAITPMLGAGRVIARAALEGLDGARMAPPTRG
jgi:hypothetical protein